VTTGKLSGLLRREWRLNRVRSIDDGGWIKINVQFRFKTGIIKQMPDASDMALVRQYARGNSEPAFAELVRRHINLVYSVALRYTGQAQDAEDVTQAVFIILARKADGLRGKTILTGWLYEVARFTAMKFLRTTTRRRIREQEAYLQSTLNDPDTGKAWQQVGPLLEEAMTRLGEKDRLLLALRFFENKSGTEAAALLGMQEWAARKRMERAVEKLRLFFDRRGVKISADVLTGAISANSVQAAPVALAKSVTAVAMAKGAAASGSALTLIKGALKIMAWTKAKTAIVASAGALLVAGTTTIAIYNINTPIQGIPKDWSVINGTQEQWQATNGVIQGHSTIGESILASGKEYHNVTLSAIVTTPNRKASMAVRLQDARNGYLIVFVPFSANDGLINLIRRLDGDETVLASYRGRLLSSVDRTAKIAVTARGPLFEVRLSGTRILRVTDATFSTGLIGFRIFGEENWPCDATFSKVTF
jgi:RNA polymerase sigma factor (sigma-70 family)